MIVSNNKRYIFVHIMKAAGTSLTNTLSASLDWRDLVLGGTPLGEQIHHHYQKYLGIGKHSTALEIRNVVGSQIWDEYYKFTFVRHPFTRTVSLYRYIQKYAEEVRRSTFKEIVLTSIGRSKLYSRHKWLNDLPEARAYLETKSFSEFIRKAHEFGSLGMKPQNEWLSDESGQSMMDFVGKIENFKVDFEKVAQVIDLQSYEITRENVSKQVKPWYENFADESDFEFLCGVFEKDFDLFDYDRTLRS